MNTTNIRFVGEVPPGYRPKPKPEPTLEQEEYNRSIYEWCSRQAEQYFQPEEYGRAFEYRRSRDSDDAVITDFFRTEQPYHEIPKDDNFYKAVRWTRTRFQPDRTLHPVAYPDLRYYPITLNTNVEAPWNLRDFRFKPKTRNVDLESEIPRVSSGYEEAYEQLFTRYEEWRIKGLMDHLSENRQGEFDDSIEVETWIKWKQELGIIESNGRIKHNLYPEIFGYNRYLVHQIKDGLRPFWINGEPQTYYWNTMHLRSHVVGPDEPDKIRAVFGAVWLLLMCELMFMWPLQSHFLNHMKSGRLLWGREIMRGGWKRLTMEGSKWGIPSTILTVDWSQFDRRLLHELMQYVFDIWISYYDLSSYEETNFYNGERAQCDPVRLRRLWDWICNAILHSPTLMPDGRLYRWTRNGFGSGYQMTQLMDTFANSIMICTCLLAMGVNIFNKSFFLRIQGDDSVATFFEQMFIIYGPMFLDKLADCAHFYFNAKLSAKKSKITDTFEGQAVLGYLYKDGLPYRTTEDLLSHFLYPESRHDSWDKKASVTIGLAYATCGTNERFFKFMKLCYEKMISKGANPQDKYLKWLKRTGMLLGHHIDTSEFPERYRLLSWLKAPWDRTDFEKQRTWPTRPGSHGRFYFLED